VKPLNYLKFLIIFIASFILTKSIYELTYGFLVEQLRRVGIVDPWRIHAFLLLISILILTAMGKSIIELLKR